MSTKPPSFFIDTLENVYLFISHVQRIKNKALKDHMQLGCDCELPEKFSSPLTVQLCGSDCLNRLLFLECSNNCPVGDFCTNRRFQNREYAKLALFQTEKKGWGVQALEFIPKGTFVIEYVGEVLPQTHFHHRLEEYKERNSKNFYFMSLKNDEIIDATMKGNISRFINHSCLPNCEIQRWTVDGLLKLGIFAIEDIIPDTEITFFYQMNSYVPSQRCRCGALNCRGLIGRNIKSQEMNTLESKITKILSQCQNRGLEDVDQVLSLSRLMVHVDTYQHRNQLLHILKRTTSNECLEKFLHYHGISLLSSWMIDPGEKAPLEFLIEILDVLKILSTQKETRSLLPSDSKKFTENRILVQESDSNVSTTSGAQTHLPEAELNEISDLLDEALEKSTDKKEKWKLNPISLSPDCSSNNQPSASIEVSSPPFESANEAPIVFKPGQTIYIESQNGRLIPQKIQDPNMISSESQVMQTSRSSAIEQQTEIIPKGQYSFEKEAIALPPNWHKTCDRGGYVYYFNSITRKTQWEQPTWESGEEESSATVTKETLASAENSLKLPPDWQMTCDDNNGVYYNHEITEETQWEPPTFYESENENKKCELLPNVRDRFRYNIAQYVAHCLSPYTRSICKIARITSRDDFEYLNQKVTNVVFAKEVNNLESIEDLALNDDLKLNINDYVKKFMSKFGEVY